MASHESHRLSLVRPSDALAAQGRGRVSTPIEEALRALKGNPDVAHHTIGRYAMAFANSPLRVTALIAAGADSLVFRLDDGNILHITARMLAPSYGTRFFDLPMIERGEIEQPDGIKVFYFIQPEALTPVSERAWRDFKRSIGAQGWLMADSGQHQLGFYADEIKLLDPFAVQRIPD